MAGIAVTASTGVMNSLLSKLSILLTDQYKQLKGARKDIGFLSFELVNMNAVLETLANTEKLEPLTKVWRDMVRETAYDIEDCIDIFMHHHGQGVDKDAGLLYKISCKIRQLRAQYKLANKIQELKARVAEQSQSHGRYKIAEAAATPAVPPVDPRIQAMFEDAKRLVGIDGPRDEITQWLMEEGDTSEQLKVVSIVGFGGLGKTTLANQVYSKIKRFFECTAFVPVSRSPDMPKILKDMVSGLGHGTMDMTDDINKLIMALTEHLADKRYLVVIDDIWSSTAWNIIRCALVQNSKKSRVITTTRIQEVAAACCSGCQGYLYEIQPLNSLDSRSLFFKRLFNTEDDCPKQYCEISEEMIKKCRGVPLAITSIASLLESQGMYVEKWEKIRDSMGHELETSSKMEWMRHVLTLSYNDLPHHLKTCLLYLGAYPEDYEIWKTDLVRLWIAEGFVPEKHGLDLEEVAEGYFNELVNRCMIQPAETVLMGEVLSCRVHDLMLDLILSKCTEENFISTNGCLHNMKGASQVRRISHQFHTRNMVPPVEQMNLSQLRSYMFFPASKCVLVLSKFELLRVLYLELGHWGSHDSQCLDLSNILSHLFLLRYLNVGGFRLKLPKKFGKLQHLMTLDVQGIWLDSSKSSLDVTSLSSLRHLELPSEPTYLELRNGVSKLSNLQTLCGFDISMNSVETIRDLGELTNLRKLSLEASRGTREDDLEIKTLKHDTLAASLHMLGNSNLRVLSVNFSAALELFWDQCFTRPRHLEFLWCPDIKTPQVPNWLVQADRLTRLYKLKVEQLLSEDVQVLAQMPCLGCLFLQAKTVPEKSIIIHSNAFPVLKEFTFNYKLSCLTFEPGAMPQLKELDISYNSHGPGSEHKVSPIAGVEHLASLEEVSVVVYAKRGEGSKLKSLCRESIQRHPRCESIHINVRHQEDDDDGLSSSEDDD